MLDLDDVKLDIDKLDNGVWWTIRMEDRQLVGEAVDKPDADAPAVLLVPLGTGYERQLEVEREPHIERLRRRDISDIEQDQLLSTTAGRAVAKKVIRGWQNLSFGGEVVPWSEDAAAKLLATREARLGRKY